MIIGLDGNEANTKERVGVSVYTLKIVEYLQKNADKNNQFIIFLKNKPQEDLPSENKYFKYKIVLGSFFWSQIFLPLALYFQKLSDEQINIFFSPAHYSPRFCPYPTVVTVHDLSYFYYPDEFLKKDLYQLTNWTKYSVEKAKKIIVVSKTTKKDLIKFYHIPEEKIEVVYNGYEKNISATEIKKLRNWSVRENEYVLYVGTIQPRKNITTLIEAFSKFQQKYPKLKLIITGKKGWLYEKIFQRVVDLGLEKEVYFTDFISDQQLAFLYQNAFCFVLPSFYEGFGIPLLEAMGYSCPIISSFNSALPEVGGDACLYFDPGSEKDLLDKLITLKENKILRNELIKKGRERVKLFSWKKCAEETLKVIINSANK